MEPVKLSVVIPVYGVEATLDRCVESVLAQKVEQMEVILIDDGSPDQCPQMCDAWAERDPRVKVIHKPNGGLSDARNAGIRISSGEYITFVDSDDWIDEGLYPTLLSMMSDYDILEYSMDGKLSLSTQVYEDISEYWLKAHAYTHTYACNKIFRRSLFGHVSFPKGKIFEDAYALPLLLRHARKIATTSVGHYHYQPTPDGLSSAATGHGLAMLLDAHLTSGMPVDDAYYMYLLNIQMDVWALTGNALRLPPRKVDYTRLSGKAKLKAILLRLLGIERLCRLNRLTHSYTTK